MTPTSEVPVKPTSDEEPPYFISDAVAEVMRLMKFSRMTDLGFTLGSRLTGIVDIMRTRLKHVRSADETLKWLSDLADELQPYAEEETASDMAYLRSLVTIRFVTILETVVQDAVAVSLEHVPSVLEREEIRRIKGPVAELLLASPSERAEFLATALAQEAKAALQAGVGKFEALLKPVGLGGEVDHAARRVLYEMLNVRNLLVHKSGRADARFLSNCPWFRVEPGAVLRITSAMTEQYKLAVVYYLAEIFMRWMRRSGLDADMEPFVQIRQNALDKLHAAAG